MEVYVLTYSSPDSYHSIKVLKGVAASLKEAFLLVPTKDLKSVGHIAGWGIELWRDTAMVQHWDCRDLINGLDG